MTTDTVETKGKQQGLLISFEGGEGAGKGTQVRLLKEALEQRGVTVELTREPGGTPVGERIRYLLKHDPAGETMRDQTELLLFIAARAQNYYQRILPALQAGHVVICDRFIDSSVVYQGLGRGLGVAPVQWLNDYATGGRRPDITFLLDVPVEVGFARVGRREVQLPLHMDIPPTADTSTHLHDRIEDAGERFFNVVRQGYLQLAAANPDRFVVIDASPSTPDTIAATILSHVAPRLAISS